MLLAIVRWAENALELGSWRRGGNRRGVGGGVHRRIERRERERARRCLRPVGRPCRLHALVAVTEQCLRGLSRAIEPGQHARFNRDYAALMRDAVDCGQATQAESEALLASAAYRIFG